MKIYAAYNTINYVGNDGLTYELDKYYEFFESELDCLRYCVKSDTRLKCKEISPLSIGQKRANGVYEENGITIMPLYNKVSPTVKPNVYA